MGLLRRKPSVGSTSGIGDTIIQLTTNGVAVVDNSMNIVFLNPAAQIFTETKQSEASGLNYMSVMRFEDEQGQNVDVVAQSKLKNAPPERRDLVVVGRQSKTKIPVELTIVQYDKGFILMLHNIKAEAQEEEASREFVATASHEMRTPVASIRGYVELALNPQTATIDERARGFLEKALAAGIHLGELFQNLLSATQLDDNQAKLRLVPVDFGAEVKRIADARVESVKAKGLSYKYYSASPGNSSIKVLEQVLYARVDVESLAIILNNLIENAIKYTEKGYVIVSLGGDKHYVWVTVADTGAGMSPSDSEHVFNKFYRADNSLTRTIGGAGLGLYIAKERAEQMGGTIQVRSEVEKGSQFSLILPRLSRYDYDKMKLAEQNAQAMSQNTLQPNNGSVQ